MTDVPDLSRKTAMVAVNPPTDTADAPDTDAAAVSLEATSDEKAVSSEKQTPKADADEGQSATKDAESASEGANKSNPLGWCLTDLKRSTARRRSAP